MKFYVILDGKLMISTSQNFACDMYNILIHQMITIYLRTCDSTEFLQVVSEMRPIYII